jgi:hypothetical protein
VKNLDDHLADLERRLGAKLRFATVADPTVPSIILGGTTLTAITTVGDLPDAGTRVPVLVDGRTIVVLGSGLTPATVVTEAAAAADGGSSTDTPTTSLPSWESESLTVSGVLSTWGLTYAPIPQSLVLRLNGLDLVEGTDFTLADNVVQFTDPADLFLGWSASWQLSAVYPHFDVALDPQGQDENVPPYFFEAPGFLTWQLNGAATIVGGTEVRLNANSAGSKGSMVCPTAIPPGWSTITLEITLNLPTKAGDGWETILWDTTQHGTTELDVYPGAPEFYFSGVIAQTPPGLNATLYQSHNGTTYVGGGSVVGDETAALEHVYRTVWTRTGADTASVTRWRDGVLRNSSPADVWVPASIYVGICGYAGGLFTNEHTVRGVSLVVT